MNLTRLIKRAAVAISLASACTGASAAITHLGVINLGATAFSGVVTPAGSFNDIFTFTAPPNGGSAYSVVNFPVVALNVNTVLTGFTLTSNPNGIIGDFDDTPAATGAGSSNIMNMTFAASAGGNYFLRVIGTANGANGGLYNGAISISPVPEPGAYGLFLAGLGLIGTIVMRRRRV